MPRPKPSLRSPRQGVLLEYLHTHTRSASQALKLNSLREPLRAGNVRPLSWPTPLFGGMARDNCYAIRQPHCESSGLIGPSCPNFSTRSPSAPSATSASGSGSGAGTGWKSKLTDRSLPVQSSSRMRFRARGLLATLAACSTSRSGTRTTPSTSSPFHMGASVRCRTSSWIWSSSAAATSAASTFRCKGHAPQSGLGRFSITSVHALRRPSVTAT
mmetsp:Transcript_72932/g.206672  ORF Transcript_72932/g.206672 Transcript_72932/m.206672 type:complete len:215 (-) Transcript_72932:1823-2467(-)